LTDQKQESAIFENKYGQKLLFKLSEIRTKKEVIRLVAVSDITKELDNGEVDAWIKLARTLSHEIMNNIAPITTLSQVISKYFTKDNEAVSIDDIDSKIIANTVKGLKVIEERSSGLMSFVDNYRKFTKLPVPEILHVNLSNLIENNLLAATTFPRFNQIKLIKHIPQDWMINTDENLLSQVIINLLKNACEALTQSNTENPTLQIKLSETGGQIRIEFRNNGPDIPPEIREQIFIPFYTTKEEGSGVGLSLSKQIMLKMDGDIMLNSRNPEMTTFTIVLN
jgi:signal transduction histidine kinase